jgi:hypothetical protein
MTAPLPPDVPDLTWKLAQEDTFWTRFLPTFLVISYSLWIRKIAKSYRKAIRDAWSRKRGE